ncbi:MAG: GMC family oxidoreductase, partial [Thermoleophilia bacterium]|nr:GMC family oxidoreductase [Thermoleophilia bacterium]
GKNDNYIWIHIPVGYLYCIDNPRADWRFKTAAEKGLNGRSLLYPRGRVLGGCSSHNTMIWFKPLPGDWDDWASKGATGWEGSGMEQYYAKLPNKHQIVPEQDRDPILPDWIESAVAATGVQKSPDWNAQPFNDGAGFLDVAYDPDTGIRSSASVSYLHPIMDTRGNLHVICDTRALHIGLENGHARTVSCEGPDGPITYRASQEVILCAGAIDSPRLLLLSGIGPADDLRELDIDVQHDLPGVGGEILDHPESIIMWELKKPLGPQTAMGADCALFVNRLKADDRPDLMYHTYQLPFTFNTERLGYPVPENVICMTPNIPRTKSRGSLWLLSKSPDIKPAIDFGYFTDADGYDEQTIVDGLEIAREVAATGPFKEWIKKEVAPGPKITSRKDLSTYGRAAHHTVYHPLGGCKIGALDDPTTVVGPDLKVKGIDGLRVADGAIFPALTTVNPVVGVLMIGEKCADLIRSGR